ncbi:MULTISPECIES: substrate-binding domain-containing protein [unclassified Aeromicrobium]|uniref:sugar ABC transporter substrate-binding protein n=1 Tax=unclassified Aeromicrobium TaxID=2633570 RepID=UPI00288B1078|nr:MULTISPECIES: substrate-binding domain-containing protein [unclassified Aeromicrobium]
MATRIDDTIGNRRRTNPRPSTGRRISTVIAGAGLLLVAACGGSGDGGGGASETSASVVEEAKAAVAKNREGTDRALPSSAPTPEAGKNVWLISCTQAGEGCSAPAAGAEEAAKTIGWDLTVFDGKGRPDVYANGIRSAIADGADGIILDVIDCVAVKSALQDARKAGVKTFAFYAFDCDDPILKDQGEPLFDAELNFGDDMAYYDYVEKVQSQSVADYVIAKTEGKAKIIEFTEDDLVVAQHLNKGFEEGLKKCGGCEIVKKVPFNLDDFVTGKLGGKAEAALTQHPDANVLYSPYDSALTVGIAQAVVASGRNDDVLVTGNEGLTPNIGFVKGNKGQDFITGLPARWVGWAAIDSMNRLLQGEDQVDQGMGFQTIDAEGPFPKQTTFYDGNIDKDGNPKQDYVANFKKIWKVS